jgi:hypothetical protein
VLSRVPLSDMSPVAALFVTEFCAKPSVRPVLRRAYGFEEFGGGLGGVRTVFDPIKLHHTLLLLFSIPP